MSEKWGISRVGKPELEVGETLQEAIIRLQILPLPPFAWTDCFLQTLRANKYVEKVVHARRRTDRDVKKAAADDRRKLQAELDQLAEKLAKPEYAEATGPE